MKTFFRSFLVVLFAVLAGCSPSTQIIRQDAALLRAPGDGWLRTELFFGMSRTDGTTVTKEQWKDFLGDTVTPRFPEGLTVVEGDGQYMRKDGVLTRERSRILILLYGPDDPSVETRIEEIRSLYKKRFRQESVLRVTVPAKVSF